MADEQQTPEPTNDQPTSPQPTTPTLVNTQTTNPTPDPAAAPTDPAAPKQEESKTETQPEPVAPLTREDLALPEGMTVSDEQFDSLLGLFNDGELSPKDRANKLVEMHGQIMQATLQQVAQNTVAEIQRQQTEWETAIKSDKEIGGANLAPNLAKVSKLLDAEGTPELRQALDATGAGSHPEIVKFFIKMADRYAEGAPAGGGSPSGKVDSAQKMYPGMNP